MILFDKSNIKNKSFNKELNNTISEKYLRYQVDMI